MANPGQATWALWVNDEPNWLRDRFLDGEPYGPPQLLESGFYKWPPFVSHDGYRSRAYYSAAWPSTPALTIQPVGPAFWIKTGTMIQSIPFRRKE